MYLFFNLHGMDPAQVYSFTLYDMIEGVVAKRMPAVNRPWKRIAGEGTKRQ